MPFDAKADAPHQVGAYDILFKIAEGGMGAVYKGRHRASGDIVAIKVLPAATAKNPVLLKRFEQEFRSAAALDHPNVVRAIEYCGTGTSPFLVMEYVDGESLGARIDRHGPMPEDQAIRLIAQVCQGLHRAHKQKLIHRDVKPDNILITRDGIAKLTDLGLVKDADNETNLTKTGRGLGTPNFMAPEQFRNAKNADIRCDIYSLGATLYTMLTGEIPFGKIGPLDCWMRKVRNELTPARELNPAVSERVDWAIRRSMSGDPDKRPASCREFVEDLTGKSVRPPSSPNGPPVADLWYLVYRDEDGEKHTVKGTTEGIRRALKEGLLGDAANVRASRSKQGQFQPLTALPEFRDLVIEPAASSIADHALRETTAGSRSRTPATPSRPDPAESLAFADPTGSQVNACAATTDYRPVPPNGDSMPRPHIQVGRPRRRATPEKKAVDWLMWAVVALIAVGTGLAAMFLLPRFTL